MDLPRFCFVQHLQNMEGLKEREQLDDLLQALRAFVARMRAMQLRGIASAQLVRIQFRLAHEVYTHAHWCTYVQARTRTHKNIHMCMRATGAQPSMHTLI